MSETVIIKIPGYDLEVEFDGFEDKLYGNHYEVLKVTIDGCAAHELLGDSVRRKIEEHLHAVVTGQVEEEL